MEALFVSIEKVILQNKGRVLFLFVSYIYKHWSSLCNFSLSVFFFVVNNLEEIFVDRSKWFHHKNHADKICSSWWKLKIFFLVFQTLTERQRILVYLFCFFLLVWIIFGWNNYGPQRKTHKHILIALIFLNLSSGHLLMQRTQIFKNQSILSSPRNRAPPLQFGIYISVLLSYVCIGGLWQSLLQVWIETWIILLKICIVPKFTISWFFEMKNSGVFFWVCWAVLGLKRFRRPWAVLGLKRNSCRPLIKILWMTF